MNMDEFNNEQLHLNKTILEMEEVLNEEKMKLNVLLKKGDQSSDAFWSIVRQRELHIANLESQMQKPYFARIDFIDFNAKKNLNVYIGKNGVSRDSNIIVVDWRAPISSLYYDSEIGECSYQSPDGEILGKLDLKRQYVIDNQKLIDYIDVDLVANDDLLQKYLNENNEARLKNIVSTIQKEQNYAIRQKLYENIIVQGVAGSGKTTVALHRLAYLIYNNMNKINQSQYIVIGPNPVFLRYIQTVLPDLDVSGVEQFTYESFASDYVNIDLSINSSEKKAANSIENKCDYSIEKFKCSMQYKDIIDEFIESYKSEFVSNDLMLGNVKLIDKNIIKENFEIAESISANLTFKQILDIITDRLCNIIEQKKESISCEYAKYVTQKFSEVKNEKEKEKLRKQFANDKLEIDRNCRGIIKKYFEKSLVDPLKLYKLFISSINNYSIPESIDIKKLKNDTLDNIKNKKCDFEDLPALIYLKQRFVANDLYNDIRHIVIDEAQDLGEFCFYAIKCALPKATFSIFGDLAQSIYDYRSIDNWDGVNDILFDNNGLRIDFNKSYRTTAEIMKLADTIAENMNLNKSETVIRHGSPVSITKVSVDDDIVKYIIDRIDNYKNKGYKSIAIISKTDTISKDINEKLKAKNINVPNVSINDDLLDEEFNVCTISNQLAKGLEFDAVIINNASEDVYSSSNMLDMKLLYVATTRALHELEILHTGEVSKPIADYTKKLSL